MDSGFSLRPIIRTGILAILTVLTIFFYNYFDTRTTLVFCDVGQGDGAYIRLRNRIDILIDAGPEQKILDCLGKYMPFYDRKIELGMITHPQKDHYGGYLHILKRYKVDTLLLSPVDSSAKSFATLKGLIKEKRVNIRPLYAGDEISVENASFRSVWPTNQYIIQNVDLSQNDGGFYKTQLDPNNFSQVVLLTVGTKKILFTGDLSPEVEQIILQNPLSVVEILKVPHHGSKNGLIEPFLQAVRPKTVIISCGQNNSFGHPHQSVIQMLEKYLVRIRRTDKEGDIVFKF